ncbi:MAG: Gfo/Idh/MocA family protein [Chloroflexota bacterium]
MERIRVGFAGLGGIARERHVPGFRALSGVEIAAVAARTPASAAATAAELGIPRAHTGWEALVADPGVDLVVVATWPDLHVPITLAALAAGKHVLCQARLSMDRAGADAVLGAMAAHPGQVVMVVPSPMTIRADAAIARIVADGTLGAVRTVRLATSGGVTTADPWRRLRRHSGNNVMALGILYEALLRWLPAATAVSATGAVMEPRVTWPDGRTEAADIPDHLVAVAELPGPIHATFDLSATPRPEPDGVTIAGTAGALRYTWGDDRLLLARSGGAPETVAIAEAERGDWRVEADVVAAIRDGAPVTRTDVPTAVRYMAFTDAVAEALRAGRRIEVPPVS